MEGRPVKSVLLALITALVVYFVLPRVLTVVAEWVANVDGVLFLRLFF
jgi:antibiotic biosynthesis monooxygenase (ABM) superfamily enzyme